MKNEKAFCLKKSHAAIFLIAIFSQSLFSAVDSPHLVSGASFQIVDEQSVVVNGGEMTALNITHSLPYGVVSTLLPPNSKVIKDEFGNPAIFIQATKPKTTFAYVVNSTVETYRQHVYSLPGAYSPPENISLYLSSDRLVDASSPAMVELAQNITKNATSKFEKAALLAAWVHERMTYDPSLTSRELTAKEILAESRGVCTEYTTLYISLARAAGIPSRYVSGYAYSDLYSAWLGHSWAEVYLGEWVGVDPTWLQVGDIDATHIAAAKKPSLGFSTSAVSALVYPPSATISFDSKSGSGGVIADNVFLLGLVNGKAQSDYDLRVSSQSVPPGGKFIAYLSLPSSEYRLVPISLLPCRGNFDVLDIQDQDRNAVTSANRTSVLVWEGEANPNLPENYQFSCPLSLNSPYLSLQTADVNVSTAKQIPWPKLEATVEDSRPGFGSSQSVRVKYSPYHANKNITLISGDLVTSQQIRANSDTVFVFPAGSPGKHSVFVFGPSGDPVSLSYIVLPSSGYNVSIAGFNGSAFVGIGNVAHVKVFPPKNGSKMAGSISIEWGGQASESERFEISTEPVDVSIPFIPSVAGSHLLVARFLADGSELASASQFFLASPPPSAEVYRVWSDQNASNMAMKVAFRIVGANGLNALTVRVGGQEVSPSSDGTATLSLPPGSYSGTLTWQDSGHEIGAPFNFTVSAQQNAPAEQGGFIPSLTEFVSTPGQKSRATAQDVPFDFNPQGAQIPTYLICPIAIILILIPISLILRRRR